MNLEETAMKLIAELGEAEAELLSASLLAYQSARITAKESKKNADVKALDSATRQLQKLLNKHASADSFKSVPAVHEHLKAQGYKVSLGTVYNHIEEGKLKRVSGKYLRTDVDEYAASLPRAESDASSGQKIKAEIEQKNIRTDLLRVQLQEKRGELISREKVAQEFSGRIFTLSRDLDRVAETVAMLIAGKTPIEVKRLLREQHLHVLKKYARELENLK